MLRDKHSKQAELLETMSEIVSTKGQYANYRKTLKSSNAPLIPFLGVYLTDLTFIDLGNLDYLPESNFINFEKRRKVASIISDIQSHQRKSFPIVEVGVVYVVASMFHPQ